MERLKQLESGDKGRDEGGGGDGSSSSSSSSAS